MKALDIPMGLIPSRRIVIAVGLVLAGWAGLEAQEPVREPVRKVPSPTGVPILWRDPGVVEALDIIGGPGGRDGSPKAPFTFEQEVLTGTNPKIRVKDANGVEWTVKFGQEVKAETFATRIAWAAGYFVEANYYVAEGVVAGVRALTRAKGFVKPDGTFRDARFERRTDKSIARFQGEGSWSWIQNPFLGTRELNGLKVILMLVSNWDNKDVRDVKRGSNTAIFQETDAEARYLITDWGASMGKWGGFLTREKWDCKGFQQQTAKFLLPSSGPSLMWGYSGQHTEDFRSGVGRDDVRWVLQYLGRISDDQLHMALEASGATAAENACFSKALRARIEAMKAAAADAVSARARH